MRKATLLDLLARASPGLRFNEHLDERMDRSSSRKPASGWKPETAGAQKFNGFSSMQQG
jgi:hypothetical protein